ncbi:MAG: ABC transporter ATP-binding protein, partial [Anaerolineales bacterium]|nr:ABC transporter ATP-binding protein [Anaerolineales bacterium]
ELLHLVGLAGLGNRFPNQLSGGQQQRVALARALAYEPAVLLLDEPFSALDVKIRGLLRRTLKQIQQQLGVTTILVTHDQEEAFELADRIGVMDRGHLLEIGSPETIYHQPKTPFAATFVGAGTVLVGRAEDDMAHFGALQLPIPETVPHEDGLSVQMLVRPEQIRLTAERPSSGIPILGLGTIAEQTFAGALRRLRLRVPRLPGTRQISPFIPFGEGQMLVDAL